MDAASDADNVSCGLQSITEQNNSPPKDACTLNNASEKNLNDMSPKDIFDNENAEDKRENIVQEKSTLTNNKMMILNISNEESCDMYIDVEGISDDSNSASRSITDPNQDEEENNSLSKNDYSNFFNSGNSLKNNDNLCQRNENVNLFMLSKKKKKNCL